jgi:hypothetical protein
LNIVLDAINQRFWLNDFRVYYEAAQHLYNRQNMYGQAFGLGTGFYKYSPFAAMVFIPLSLLDYNIAKIIFFICSSSAIFGIFIFFQKIIKRNFDLAKPKLFFLLPFALFLICAVHLQREIHLGNLNMILLFSLLISFKLMVTNRKIFAGILLAIIICFKPHFFILLPLLIIRKEWKVLSSLTLSACFFIFLPSILVGWQQNFTLLIDWKNTILKHNASVESNEQTFQYMLFHFLKIPYSIFTWAVPVAVIAISFLILCMQHFKTEKQNENFRIMNFASEYFILIAIIPNLVLTDTEHFLLAMPILFGLLLLLNLYENKRWFLIGSIIFLVLFGAKATGLIGNDLADFYLQNSLLGISNFVLIILFVIKAHNKSIIKISHSSTF